MPTSRGGLASGDAAGWRRRCDRVSLLIDTEGDTAGTIGRAMILRLSLRHGPAMRDFIVDAQSRATIAELTKAIGGAGAKELYRATTPDEIQPLPSKAVVAESGVL